MIWNRFFPGEDKHGYDRLSNETESEYKDRLRQLHEETKQRAEEDKLRKDNIRYAVEMGILDENQAAQELQNLSNERDIEYNMRNKGATKVNTDWGAAFKDHSGNYYDSDGNLLE